MDHVLGRALINDVLDLSKIEAGKMEIESVSYNLRMEIDNVFSLFDDEVQQKQLDVSMLVHELVPACVIGDPGRFRQVWLFLQHTRIIDMTVYVQTLLLFRCRVKIRGDSYRVGLYYSSWHISTLDPNSSLVLKPCLATLRKLFLVSFKFLI